MRVTAFVTALFLATAATAQEGPIRNTIQSQIDAFLADDFATAFSFASPTIKGLFGSADRFGQMVQQGYPMVHRPQTVRMLDLREVNGRLWQKVMITDQQGRTHVLDYQMIETPEGWQINGVQLLPDVGVGA
ncbi:DUF4864 domain-containing protein [Pseudotabrizicola sp. L79]|uniref:DUF4864 domain-containing protein n=1 Tax=Pseudotabrizicola sp. L79 TaxID=3118402 RepID=UPI002F92A4EA